jgi:neutral ceramidase
MALPQGPLSNSSTFFDLESISCCVYTIGVLNSIAVSGPIEYRHMFLDMRNLVVEESNFTRPGTACKPAMGFAFAAGTTDGPGAFDFRQGDTNGTAFWRLVRNFIREPTPEQEACHAPKPILLDVGEMHFPYEWVPYIVEIQILKIGQLVLLAVPGEFTTMAGRRLRAAVKDIVAPVWGDDVHLVIAGLSNTYSSYVTTWEEYQVQRYEGGFTLYGPSTLDAYIQEFRRLATAMTTGTPISAGPSPPDLLSKQWSLVPGVVVDAVPPGKEFGQVSKDVPHKMYVPGDTVSVEFHSGCPRNDIRAEGTYLTVERKTMAASSGCWDRLRWYAKVLWHATCGPLFNHEYPNIVKQRSEKWEVVHTDNDWETKFIWHRPSPFSPFSYATVVWQIPANSMPGIYRIRHFGNRKHFWGHVQPFEGASSEFRVAEGHAIGWNHIFHSIGRRVGPIF